MKAFTRRSAFAAFGAALLAPVLVHAQGATNAPAGGVASTTAPSNSAGTPSGGTGVVSTTQVAPSGAVHHRRRRHRRHHTATHAAPSSTQ